MGANVSPTVFNEEVRTTYTQDNSRLSGRMPLTIPRDDASEVKFSGSCSQSLCTVGGGNSGTTNHQNEGGAFPGTPSPSNSSAFDSSIPSCNMISNSSHPAFDHMVLKSTPRSSSSARDSGSPSPNLEGGLPSIDDVIVVSSVYPRGWGSSSWSPRSTNEILCRGRSDARLQKMA